MSRLRVRDNGETVELDLHGASVREAISLVDRAIEVSRERGRSTLRVIHGSSTSDRMSRNQTIKHALEDHLEQGMRGVTSHYMMEDVTILGIVASSASNPTRITLLDLH